MKIESAVYTGILHHRRSFPRVHDFSYPVVMFYLDLSEIDSLFKIPFLFSNRFPRILGFKRGDYLKGKPSLAETVHDLLLEKLGVVHRGPIRMLTQIRYLGFCFNPVTFYYCFDESGEKLEFIVSEITNTPWNERHSYVLDCREQGKRFQFKFKKAFHVSPFFPMALDYVWGFNQPCPEKEQSCLSIDMEDWDPNRGEMVFEAHLSLKPKPLQARNLLLTVIQFPLMTLKTFISIYFQAMRLYLKKVPFYSHPSGGK